jgi:GAF domain-containing protein
METKENIMENTISKPVHEKIELEDIPFARKLSLDSLIEFWEQSQFETHKMKSTFATPILEKLKAAPELRGIITDFSVFKKHEDLVDVLMSVLYAPAQWDNTIAASLVPFDFQSFYSTDLFKRRFTLTQEEVKKRFASQKSSSAFLKTMKAYSFILQELYGVENKVDYTMTMGLPDSVTGLERYYRLSYDPRFMKVVVNGEKPNLQPDCIKQMLNEPKNLKLWMEKLPPDRFEFHGFTTITAVDITNQEVLSQLKHDLLESHSIVDLQKFTELETKLKIYFNSPSIKLGLAYLPDSNNMSENGRTIGHSFMLHKACELSCSDFSKSVYENAFFSKHPEVIENLETKENKNAVDKEFLKLGLKSLIIAPLFDGDRFIGILEIGSTMPGEFSTLHTFKVKELLGLFSIAVKRSQEEYNNKIQALIKEECTALHPVVDWRFQEAAMNLVEKRQTEKSAELEPIVFEDVYPLYAVSDIRNSSHFRNESIQIDLIEHMRMVQDIFRAALTIKPLPFLDEMNFRLTKYFKIIQKGLNSGDEVTVLDFLRFEVGNVFNFLKNEDETLKEMIERYENVIDPNLHSFYSKRKEYESAVSHINETISNYLETAEEKAQEMFPHYFEKYKTDGVEHGIYIGSSLVNNRNFDMMYLHNLRLWQLITVCEIARKTEELLPNLSIPLETTHLILVQHTPLSIRFRMDEKKFDVDGTYNIRYEIMKKRIDKATISGTTERLTQPRKIAIVYSQNKEAAEYNKYIEYLQTKGYLKPEVEYLDLESLQGVSGLRAIRVTVDVESPKFKMPDDEVRHVIEVAQENVN